MTACNSEQRDTPGETPGGGVEGGEISVILTLDLPSPGIPTTYGMSEDDENRISTADVLAFKQVGGVEYFAYRAQATLIEDTNESNQKKITVKLQVSDDLHRFVVLANAHSEIDALGDIAVTGEKDEVLARLFHTHTGYWDINQPIPMWGESNLLPITETTSQISGLSLLRMVSRIDVITAVPRDSFELQEFIYITIALTDTWFLIPITWRIPRKYSGLHCLSSLLWLLLPMCTRPAIQPISGEYMPMKLQPTMYMKRLPAW
ncbi:MAG: FimB/Mfa2 family fimbrial subunit [Tannerellaceae bacterium]|nr:FimB/Mfa2 family fimbrial subunit [Tannerellaceae bacterium]MCD8264893.1 FimB/Mfa2 family fimbrial subunit [Tannerellaceae bacterium]